LDFKKIHKTNISENEKLGSHIDMYTHADSTLHNPVILTFNLLNSESMHAEVLP